MLSSEERARLERELAKYIGGNRYAHSLNVADAAIELARHHAPELAGKAEIAGLLHDNAKKMPTDELLAYTAEHQLGPSPEELALPKLLHGMVGSHLLSARFGIEDEEIASACRDHVTGRPGMGPLSRLLYVADQTSADRDFPQVDELRDLAKHDLPAALLWVARNKIIYSMARGTLIEPKTVAFYNSMVNELQAMRE